MDSPKSLDMGEEVRMSPKLSSRRKRSRPVKFNQDFIMTDEFPHTSAYLSPVSAEKQSYESTESFMGAEATEFLQTDYLSPISSPRKIQLRQVTSIRDVSLMKGSASKRVKVDDNGRQDSAKLEGKQGGQQTTFSSLLHTFASQVNNRVETNEYQSPYSESSAIPKTIWPVTNSSPSTLPSIQYNVQSDTSRQSQRTSDSPARNSGQDMSFSGMLQNFVSCVNDSPTIMKGTSAQQSSLKSLLTINQQSVDRISSTNGSPFTGSSSTPVGNDQQSFAGLLHSFASVVDRGNQESLQEKRHHLRTDQHLRSSPSRLEHTQKASKSLLDVLHDTISRRVLETASSPQQDESIPQTRFSQSSHNTQLDKVMQFNMDIPAQAKAPTRVERRGHVEDFTSRKAFQARADRYEPNDELHPNSHQWSHIKNVLPPLDDTEEDARIDQNQSDRMLYHVQTIKMEPQDEEPSLESNYDQGAPEEHSQYLLTGAASLDDDDEEADSSHLQVTVKQEPETDPPGGSECEMSGKDVNTTLRERLLMRIGSRQSLHQSPSLSSSSTLSTETRLPHQDSTQRSLTQVPGEPSGSKQPLPNQAGLVSHLLSTGNSSHWRNKENGSFADLLHNITSSMLEKDETDDKREESLHSPILIKQEPIMSDEEPQIESVHEYESAQDHLGSLSLTSLLQKERTDNLKDSNNKKKVPRCVTRLHSNPSQSADYGDREFSDRKGTRAQKKAVSYAEAPSLSSSPSLSSDDTNTVNVSSRTTSKLVNCLPTRAKHSNLMKHRWKRGSRYGLKIKQGWPNKRKDDLYQKRGEMRSVHISHKTSSGRRTDTSGHSTTSPAQKRSAKADTMSFTDILQQLAQKCQAGGQDPALQGSFEQNLNQNSTTYSTHDQTEHTTHDRQQVSLRERSPSFHSDVLSNVPSSANLKNLLLQQSSLTRKRPEVESPSRTPSTSVASRDVSFSDIMQNMASTVTKKRGSSNVTEDLTSLDPPVPWVKSMSGNWLRFVLISPDENPRISISVSVNLWNTIHEVKIHCHHLEVPANHWIFRRFGKRIHTKAALQGVLQAISNGCSVCEGTTRGDLVHMYRNKLASTTRWQAAALLEDSFGTATIRSSQCELLVSGLRRSREKRCSKCSKFVDRKLKAVMYHMKKKLGLS